MSHSSGEPCCCAVILRCLQQRETMCSRHIPQTCAHARTHGHTLTLTLTLTHIHIYTLSDIHTHTHTFTYTHTFTHYVLNVCCSDKDTEIILANTGIFYLLLTECMAHRHRRCHEINCKSTKTLTASLFPDR